MKKDANKLVIIKDLDNIDEYNLLTYVFEWYQDSELVIKQECKVDTDKYGFPVEHFTTDELIDHKMSCCLNIEKDTFNIEVVYL